MNVGAAIEAADARGRGRHARWQSGLFRSVAERLLVGSSAPSAHVEAWLDLLAEGLGRGALDERAVAEPARHSLLATLVLARAPRALGELPPERLAELWNLGEGAARSDAWVGRVLAQVVADDATPLARDVLEGRLAETLDALGRDVDALPAERWRGGDAEVHSLRDAFPRFVPGRLRLVRPRVVVTTDRCSDAEVAICVLPSGTVMTHTRARMAGTSPAPVGPLAMSPGALRLGDARWRCPGASAWQHVLCSPAGFAVGTALDSQRLWVARAS